MAEQDAGPTVSESPPGHIGQYEIVGELGRGATGVTYRARASSLRDREVALKEVRLNTAAAVVEKKIRESSALLRLHGLHVVAVHDVFAANERSSICVVTELVRGETLRDRMGRGRMDLSEIVSVLDGVLDALETMHGVLDEDGSPAPVLHRALKPENVGFQPWRDGETVKVMDLGIARIADDERRIERALASLETRAPAYAAPEVLFGEVASPAADIWSAGVILWELCAGRHPFDGAEGRVSSPAQLLIQHQGVLPPLPDDVRAHVPAEIAELVCDLCAHDPALRPTARQARDRLARASLPGDAGASSGTSARPSGARWSSGPRPAGSRRARALVVAAVAVGVLCVAGGVLLFADEMTRDRSRAQAVGWPGASGLGTVGPTASALPARTAQGWSGTAAPSCPELAAADPLLARLSVAELERRILAAGAPSPELARRQLEALRARAASVGAGECIYRLALITTLWSLRDHP
ncbi:MAG: serine/threonine protein kinase [Deltaproteobacteria bacterium]|nr:serine/threonine protein kinase [Deltaproteobacteria bacterium]